MNAMEIKNVRYNFGEDFTLSRVTVNGVKYDKCPYVLEDAVREVAGKSVECWKIKCVTAIPVGRYEVTIDMSQRFGKRMLHLLNVCGYDGVRVHSGNTSHDTEGCLIVGKERNEKAGEVSGSRLALAPLFEMIDSQLALGNKVYWIVEGLPTTKEKKA